MKPIAIIGSGLAGYTVAREFRKLDKTTPVLIITGDDGGFYSKPMLSNAFAQGKTASHLRSQTADQMAAQINATILTRTQVRGIDTTKQSVHTSAGEFEFSQLVLAVGAQAIRLPFAGNAADQVLSVNTLDDYAVLRDRLSHAGASARVAIIGAGLIGCEFADDLSTGGHQVTLIDPNPAPLAALAPPVISAGLQAALQARHVQFRMGTTSSSIDRTDTGLRITLANGEHIDVDVILSAVGLRADIRLAQEAHLQAERGILVDKFGQTSVKGIYALGDCAQYAQADGNSITLPYVAPIMAAARAIAQSLAGTPTAIDFKPAPVLVKTPSYPIALVAPPLAVAKRGQWESELKGSHPEVAASICRFIDNDGVIRGFAVAPQEAKIRNTLLSELGTVKTSAIA